ncbi:MAG: hypothetical protein ABIP80_04580 [Ferruginibacter sp.]
MKYFLFTSLWLTSLTAISQDCKTYYFLQNNKTIEMTIYNKKGEASAKQVYSVSDYKNSGGVSTATVNSEMFDKKGKSSNKSTSRVKCTGGVIMMDMNMKMPQGQKSAITNAKTESMFIEYPSKINVGENLKDGHMDIDMDNSGMKQNVTLDIINRKVEGKEKITTTAGTWECYKINYSLKMKIKTMGIGVPLNMDVTEWFAPGFGVVKTQSKYGDTAITSIK